LQGWELNLQAALQAEKQTLQTRITQLEAELASAKAATPVAAAAAPEGADAEKEGKMKQMQEELDGWSKVCPPIVQGPRLQAYEQTDTS
jgi:hypothetical protein